MNKNDEIIVKFSKIKIFSILLACLLFVLLGYIMFLEDFFFIKAVGILSILFFGFGMIFLIKMLFFFSPALIVNSKGIYDNSSKNKAGMILWDEINNITITTVSTRYSKKKFISIYLKDSSKYLKKGNLLKHFFTNINNSIYGTPIHISSTFLKIDFETLNNLINEKFDFYKSKYE